MKYQVLVGNIGEAVDTDDVQIATEVYNNYCHLSRTGYGRCSYETVTLMMDGEPEKEMDMHGLMDFMIALAHREGNRNPVQLAIMNILKERYDDCIIQDSAMTVLQATLNDIEDYCQHLRKKLTNGEDDG